MRISPFKMAIDSGAQSKTPTSFGKQGFGIEDQQKLQQVLTKKLGPSLISQRSSSTEGQRVAFVETWKLISLANELFGFNGWSNSITSQTIDYVDELEGRYHVGVSACVRVTLKDGAYHEELGYGVSEGLLSKGSSIEKARKEAVSDGLKRSLRHFGNALGNCLGDKLYLQWVVNAADARPDSCSKSCDSLLSGLVTSSQMTAPASAATPVTSAPSLVLEAQQQQQQPQPQQQLQQQVLQVQLPPQTTALQAQRLPAPFQQQLPILQPIALATGTGGLNTSSAQQLFFVRPMSQAGLSSGVATLAAIPSSGLQTLTALPSSSLHTLTQLPQHPHLSQPAALAQATQLSHPPHLSQPAQLSQQSHLAQALHQSSTQPIIQCSQQQAQHFAPLNQSVQSILTPHQPKTSITQAVNQIKTLFNKNKQPIFSTCPALFTSNSISGNLQCISASASTCTTSAPVSSSLNSIQTLAHCGIVSSLSTPVVTTVPSGVQQNGVTHAKSLNVINASPHVGQSVTNNNTHCLNSNIKIIQNRYQGKPRSSIPPSTYGPGPVRDIQPRISSQVSQQREKVHSNSSDSSESQSLPRLRVICPPLECESSLQPVEQNLPLNKKKRARSRSNQRANNDPGEKSPPANKDAASRAAKRACIPLVTIHCPLEANAHVDIKQEKIDYDDAVPALAYTEPLNKCEVVIESSYSLSSKEDEVSLASEKDNDGDDEDEDDESVTVAKAMNTLFREVVRGLDSDFDQMSDHLLKEVGKACSPLKFSPGPTNAVNENPETQRVDKQPETVGSSLKEGTKTDEKCPSNTFSSHPSTTEKVISAAESERIKDLKMKEDQQKIKFVSELSPKASTMSEAGENHLVNMNEKLVLHVPENETLIRTETKRIIEDMSVSSSVLDVSGNVNDDMRGKNEVTAVLLNHLKVSTAHDKEKSSIDENDQVGDELCKDPITNTTIEIESPRPETKGKNEANHPNHECVINDVCTKDMTGNFVMPHKNKGNCVSASLSAKNTDLTEDTIGASLARAEKEFKAKTERSLKKKAFKAKREMSLKSKELKAIRERSLQSKPETSSLPKPVASSVAETGGAFGGNAGTKSKATVDAGSVAKADAFLKASSRLKASSLLVKPDDSFREKTDTLLVDNAAIFRAVKVDTESFSNADATSRSTIASESISEAETVSRMETEVISEMETSISPTSAEAGSAVTGVESALNTDALKAKTKVVVAAAASHVEWVAKDIDTSSCKSTEKEKVIMSENDVETTGRVFDSEGGKQSEVLDNQHLVPNLCEGQSIGVELNLPSSHASEDHSFEDLFETVNSPTSDNENSFMGFPEALQASVSTEDGVVQQASNTSLDKNKRAMQNWKFKFRVRESSATNTRLKKAGRTSSPVPSSGSPSCSKNLPRNSSSGKKAGGDAEMTCSSHEPSLICSASSASTISSLRGEPIVVTTQCSSQVAKKQHSAERNSSVTSAAGETGDLPLKNRGITSGKASVSTLPPTGSELAKQMPLSQPDDTTDSAGDSTGKEPMQASVTAIITEDAAVSSLSTLVTNGPLLPSSDASSRSPHIDRAMSPTIGRDCRKDRLSTASQAQHLLEGHSDASVKREVSKSSHGKNENGEIKYVRKFESVVNGDVR